GVAAMLLFTGLALAWFEAGFAAPWPFLLASSIALGLMLFLVPRSGIRRSGMQAYLSLTYLVLPLFILLALLDPWRQGISHYAFVLGLFAMIWTFDSFAYLTGKLLGKHPLAPRISPKKTWEGFAGGLLFVILAAVLWHNWHPGPGLVAWLLLALVAGIAGTLGDLFESSLKRSAGVKDSGTLIPGHGGVLDRFDSILFAAPPALLILLLFYTH
ncbi:MAG TPA: phosphatidate cytidylyltransferase, partial [Bacteroidales bacterium]|nr:phosphatidate cytidylyltransferase [Bacteroidales bacterium]